MIKKLFFVVFSFIFCYTHAQNSADIFDKFESKSVSGGHLAIKQSQELYQATNDHIYYVKNEKGVDRYRIWIFTGSRVDQLEERTRFVKEFPEYKIHPTYQAPDFHLFVGDFYHRNDAKKALEEIRKVFPNAFDRVFPGEIEADGDYIKIIKVNKN